MVIKTLSGVMRLPFLPIALLLTVAVMLYVGAMHSPKAAADIWELALPLMFLGSIGAGLLRTLRLDRSPFAKMESAEFKALCKANADARITFYDSVRSGNCIIGSLGFAWRTFRYPLRRSITLGELLPYCRTGDRVKSVAIYALMRLSKSSALRPATQEVAK